MTFQIDIFLYKKTNKRIVKLESKCQISYLLKLKDKN